MEDVQLFIDFGKVSCGQKATKIIKIENTTKKTQVLEVRQETISEISSDGNFSRFQVSPVQTVLQPKQTIGFKVQYCSHVEDVLEGFNFDIIDDQTLIRSVRVRAQSVGPSLSPTTFNVKFFRFRDVNQTVKHIEITNTTKEDITFLFDLDEDQKYLQISQTHGVIPGGLKFALKLTFYPQEPGVYYKKIFCLLLYHEPLIFNILGVYKPKVNLEPKTLEFNYPMEWSRLNNYEVYMCRDIYNKLGDGDKIQPLSSRQKCLEDNKLGDGDKIQPLSSRQKCLEDLDLSDITSTDGSNAPKTCWILPPEPAPSDAFNDALRHLFLTTTFIDVQNFPEVLEATTLINFSKFHQYYYEWNHDPKEHFQISPSKGFIKPNTKIDFAIYFTPHTADHLYHVELDIKVFAHEEEPKTKASKVINLPLTMSARIIGHSFPTDSCGWVHQCKIRPKILHLRSCVPNEKIYGTFIVERVGHLPVNFVVLPPKSQNFTVRPTLGYFSKSVQLFVVKFIATQAGKYMEDLKIKFNKSDQNIETIRLFISVEKPHIEFGKNNTVIFPPVYPQSLVSTSVRIRNTTTLSLKYEFQIAECLTWVEVVNPTGIIEGNGSENLQLIFKPDIPTEYREYISCKVTSINNLDYSEKVQLLVMGSCQFGYLVATPSIYDFGTCIFKKQNTVQIHLFNFSLILIYFQLKAVTHSFPAGQVESDLLITPTGGLVAPKSSMTIDVTLTPHLPGDYEYAIECQNFKDNSNTAEPCGDPRKIVLLQVKGVLPYIQVTDLNIYNGGPLFSPHLLWEMLRINQLNAALKSLKSRRTVKAKIPEAIKYSNPITLAFLIEARHDKVIWNVNIEVQCPCYEASTTNLGQKCVHTAPLFVRPLKYVTKVLEKTVLLIKLHYDVASESVLVMTINLPYKRQVILKMPQINLPKEPPTSLSTYFNPTFKLQPVFIGDPQPPLHLFWLYNNTAYPASYSVNMEALEKVYPQKVFGCINPEGIIPPFTSHPLGITFRPTEMITYMAYMPIQMGNSTPTMLKVIGEGELHVDILRSLSVSNPLPKSETREMHNGDVQCCENFIGVPLIGTHSRATRIFFLKNHSRTDTWHFHWSRYTFEDILSIRIEPESGLIKPNEKVPMTLFLKTFRYSTTIKFSVACETLNFTANAAYEKALSLQKLLEQQNKENFVITEKGTSHMMNTVTIPAKSSPCIIFLTVSANILSSFIMEQMGDKKLRYASKARKEIHKNLSLESPLTLPTLQLIQGILEKLLWDILCHRSMLRKIKDSPKSKDFIYMQILPQSHKERKKFARVLEALPSKCFVQNVLECTIQELLRKANVPKNSEELFN